MHWVLCSDIFVAGQHNCLPRRRLERRNCSYFCCNGSGKCKCQYRQHRVGVSECFKCAGWRHRHQCHHDANGFSAKRHFDRRRRARWRDPGSGRFPATRCGGPDCGSHRHCLQLSATAGHGKRHQYRRGHGPGDQSQQQRRPDQCGGGVECAELPQHLGQRDAQQHRHHARLQHQDQRRQERYNVHAHGFVGCELERLDGHHHHHAA